MKERTSKQEDKGRIKSTTRARVWGLADNVYDSLLFPQSILKRGMYYASFVIAQNHKPIQQTEKSCHTSSTWSIHHAFKES